MKRLLKSKRSVHDTFFYGFRYYYTHLVTAKNEQRGLQISNNHGYVNGWTKTVYGKVIRVVDE